MREWTQSAYQLCETFREQPGSPEHVSDAVMEWIRDSEDRIACRSRVNPTLEELVDLLRHCRTDRLTTSALAYVHYRTMVEYVAGDPRLHYPLKTEGGSFKLPPAVPEDAQAALWNSLVYWRPGYDGVGDRVIGDWLVAVHLAHLDKYGLLFRTEFLLPCLWRKSADWLITWPGARELIGLENLHMIAEVLEVGKRHDLSPLEALIGDTRKDEAIQEEEWLASRWCYWGMAPNLPVEHQLVWDQWAPQGRTGLLSQQEEVWLNESLRQVISVCSS